jgi:hypothetical protein
MAEKKPVVFTTNAFIAVIPGAILTKDPPFHGIGIDFKTMEIIGSGVRGTRKYRIMENNDTYSLWYDDRYIEWDLEYEYGSCAGQIMMPGRTYPDPKSVIVTQSAPGLFNAYEWSGVRADLIGTIGDIKDPDELAKKLTYHLEYLGYDKTERKNKQLKAGFIVDKLHELINQTEVEHQTQHMKLIFTFTNALWMAI